MQLLKDANRFLDNMIEVPVPAGLPTDSIDLTIDATCLSDAFVGCDVVVNGDNANALKLGEIPIDNGGGIWTAHIKAGTSGGLNLTGHGTVPASSEDGDVTPQHSTAGDMASGFPLQLRFDGRCFVKSITVNRNPAS